VVTHLRLGTRGSALALAQSGQVAAAITRATGTPVSLVTITSAGDNLAIPINAPGQAGLFVATLRDRLLGGDVDLVVHSYKDLPSAPIPGLVVAAVPARAERSDVAVTATNASLAELAAGSRIGTSSPRRAAALGRQYPALDVVAVRGNVDTRLAAVASGRLDGVILAQAGLVRLSRQDVAAEVLDPEVFVPAPAQGALAVECRSCDTEVRAALAHLDDPASHAAVLAERAVLAGVAASCTTAVGATAWVRATGGSVTVRLLADLAHHRGIAYSRAEDTREVTGVLPATGALADRFVEACCGLGNDVAARLLRADD
jgi:hydroxymethylbilane synthase